MKNMNLKKNRKKQMDVFDIDVCFDNMSGIRIFFSVCGS